ncbi:MAG TPA: hypothetical protein VEJ46_11275 [Candidatus Acidoferrum sp.]|nr:hypothetical protein [Candidatus Acidoferrum sp.]
MSDDLTSLRSGLLSWPVAQSAKNSLLERLDDLIRRGAAYSDKNRITVAQELRDFQRETVSLLALLGPECRELAAKADKMKFPAVGDGALWPGGRTVRYKESDDPNVTSEVTLAGHPPELSDLEQSRCYQDLARLTTLLTQARKQSLGQPSLYARRAERRKNSLDRLVRAVLPDDPNLSQEDVRKRVDELCAREKKKTPILSSWQKRGATSLLSAYENPSTRGAVATYISKRRSAVKKTSQS